jgi:hypothetical protein
MPDPPVLRLLAPVVDPQACWTPGCRLPALPRDGVCSPCARVYAGVLVLCHRLLVRDLARLQHDAPDPAATAHRLPLGPRPRAAGPWPDGLARFDGRELAALQRLAAELGAWGTPA